MTRFIPTIFCQLLLATTLFGQCQTPILHTINYPGPIYTKNYVKGYLPGNRTTEVPIINSYVPTIGQRMAGPYLILDFTYKDKIPYVGQKIVYIEEPKVGVRESIRTIPVLPRPEEKVMPLQPELPMPEKKLPEEKAMPLQPELPMPIVPEKKLPIEKLTVQPVEVKQDGMRRPSEMRK